MKINQVKLPPNREFGFLFSIIFFIISVILFFFDSTVLSKTFLFLGIIFAVISLTFPKVLEPINRLWILFGILIGKIMSPIILGLIYFLIFTPISIISKFFGRDELRLRFKSNQSSWINRGESTIEPESFKNQF